MFYSNVPVWDAELHAQAQEKQLSECPCVTDAGIISKQISFTASMGLFTAKNALKDAERRCFE